MRSLKKGELRKVSVRSYSIVYYPFRREELMEPLEKCRFYGYSE
jgi:hypothetical protein